MTTQNKGWIWFLLSAIMLCWFSAVPAFSQSTTQYNNGLVGRGCRRRRT